MIKGNEAKKLCPEINLARVPEKRGKADLGNYRKASCDVMTVLSRFSKIIEKASVDEAFLDITTTVRERIRDLEFSKVSVSSLPKTHVAGFEVQRQQNNIKHQPAASNSVAVSGDSADDKIDQDIASSGVEYNRQLIISDWLSDEGNDHELALAVGAMITLEMRQAVYQETGFTCSAGIAHNKVKTTDKIVILF